MNSIKTWTVGKTSVINIEGKPVAVDTLPQDIQFEIETYDKFKQDYLNILYQKDVLHHAVRGKLEHITGIIKQFMMPKETTNTGDKE